MARVWEPNCWIIFHLFVKGEVFVSFTDHKWSNHLRFLFLNDRFRLSLLDCWCLFFFLSFISILCSSFFSSIVTSDSFLSLYSLFTLLNVLSFRYCVLLLLLDFGHFVYRLI